MINSLEEIARCAKYDHGAQQKEDELARLLSFLVKHNVKRILEIGVDAGGTLYAWSKIVPEVFGVTLFNAGFASGLPTYDHGANLVVGNSHDPHTINMVKSVLSGNLVDFLFIDGDHTYAGVHNDFWSYKQFVKPDGWIGLHDICEFTEKTNDLKVHLFWQDLIKVFPAADVKEIKAFPQSWGGIGLIRNRPDYEYLPMMGLVQCDSTKTLFSGDEYLKCEFPKDHNIGVASQHYSQGVYWW